MYCPSCGKENAAEARFCQSCGKAMPTSVAEPTPSPTNTAPALPPWPTGGQPYRPPQAVAARPSANVGVAESTPTAITIAGVLYFVVAFITVGLGALQLMIGAAGYAIWNIAIGAVCALIGYWIMQRQHRGYSWGLTTAVLSLIGSVVQSIAAPSLIAILIPFDVVLIVILWTHRQHFTK